MKKALLITLMVVTSAIYPVYATQSLSFSGPTTWIPGASIVLAVQDTYGNLGGSYGLSYWVQVNTTIAPFLTITGVTNYIFNDVIYPPFPWYFNTTSGADPGYLSTTTVDGRSGDLGATTNPLSLIPDGSYHVTDITFCLTANAPAGTYTLRTTTANPRGSVQVTSDFGDAAFPQASFVFNVVPEPSTLVLVGLAGLGAGMMGYRHRN